MSNMTKDPGDYLAELSHWDSDHFDEHWATIDELIAEAGAEPAWQAAVGWCASPDPDIHAAGLDLLGSLTRKDAERLPALLDQLKIAVASVNEDVRWSAAVAMQQLNDDRTQEFAIALLSDADSDVRYQALDALPIPHEEPVADDHPVVTALLGAMEDPDGVVRDWATFTLGQQVNVDSTAVREAFIRRLDDPASDTAGEAAHALALRHDPRVLPVLHERLADPDPSYLYVWAAEKLADPQLLPLLQRLQSQDWPADEMMAFVLPDAIKACSGIPPE